jgi:hypothetical protein
MQPDVLSAVHALLHARFPDLNPLVWQVWLLSNTPSHVSPVSILLFPHSAQVPQSAAQVLQLSVSAQKSSPQVSSGNGLVVSQSTGQFWMVSLASQVPLELHTRDSQSDAHELVFSPISGSHVPFSLQVQQSNKHVWRDSPASQTLLPQIAATTAESRIFESDGCNPGGNASGLTNNTPAKTRNPVNKINSKNNCPRCEKLNGSLGRNKGGRSESASADEIGEKSEYIYPKKRKKENK